MMVWDSLCIRIEYEKTVRPWIHDTRMRILTWRNHTSMTDTVMTVSGLLWEAGTSVHILWTLDLPLRGLKASLNKTHCQGVPICFKRTLSLQEIITDIAVWTRDSHEYRVTRRNQDELIHVHVTNWKSFWVSMDERKPEFDHLKLLTYRCKSNVFCFHETSTKSKCNCCLRLNLKFMCLSLMYWLAFEKLWTLLQQSHAGLRLWVWINSTERQQRKLHGLWKTESKISAPGAHLV